MLIARRVYTLILWFWIWVDVEWLLIIFKKATRCLDAFLPVVHKYARWWSFGQPLFSGPFKMFANFGFCKSSKTFSKYFRGGSNRNSSSLLSSSMWRNKQVMIRIDCEGETRECWKLLWDLFNGRKYRPKLSSLFLGRSKQKRKQFVS